MMLYGKFLGQSVMRCNNHQAHRISPRPHGDYFFFLLPGDSLITYPTPNRYTTPAHSADQTTCERFSPTFVAVGPRHGDGLRSIPPLCISSADRVLARRRRLEHPESSTGMMRYTTCALTRTGFLQCRCKIRRLLARW